MALLIPGKLLYLAVPRTASVATESGLLAFDGAERLSEKHTKLMDVIKSDLPFTGDEIVCLTIRNPYDILVTDWIYEQNRYPHFDEFVEQYEQWPFVVDGRIDWLVNEAMETFDLMPEAFAGTEVMRYENLGNDLNTILAMVDLPPIRLVPKNTTKDKKPWRSYYDPTTIEIVNRRFGGTIETWGYKLLNPEQKRSVGAKRYHVNASMEVTADTAHEAAEAVSMLSHLGLKIDVEGEPEELGDVED